MGTQLGVDGYSPSVPSTTVAAQAEPEAAEAEAAAKAKAKEREFAVAQRMAKEKAVAEAAKAKSLAERDALRTKVAARDPFMNDGRPRIETVDEAIASLSTYRGQPADGTGCEDGGLAMRTLGLYLSNLLDAKKRADPKFRTINEANPKFTEKVGRFAGGVAVLAAVGFSREGGALVLSEESHIANAKLIAAVHKRLAKGFEAYLIDSAYQVRTD